MAALALSCQKMDFRTDNFTSLVYQNPVMATMRAVLLRGVGGPPSSLIAEAAAPMCRAPGKGEVRIKVKACAVAYRDCLDRRGAFPFIKTPTILGHEFAGESMPKQMPTYPPSLQAYSYFFLTEN